MMSHKAPTKILKFLNNLYHTVSHPYSFFFIGLVIVGWYVGGFISDFSEKWYKAFHLFEITIALLMVFLIENTTHADNRAMQEKLDELIKKIPQADDAKIGLERKYKGEVPKGH